MRIFFLILITLCVSAPAQAQRPKTKSLKDRYPNIAPEILLYEPFEDNKLLERGWYDGKKFTIAKNEGQVGKGCIEYARKEGATTPDNSSGIRYLFEPTDEVHLKFRIKLSKNWEWSGKDFHPHLMHFMTTENDSYRGPASSHLTMYVEPQNGKLRLAAQDIENKDSPSGLTQGPLKGGYNGQMFDSKEKLFTDDQWHTVVIMLKLNSLDQEAKKPNADGKVRAYFDDKEVVDRSDVILRSIDFPNMKFNQFLLTPYFGPGLLPHAQKLWIDELVISKERLN